MLCLELGQQHRLPLDDRQIENTCYFSYDISFLSLGSALFSNSTSTVLLCSFHMSETTLLVLLENNAYPNLKNEVASRRMTMIDHDS